METQTIEFRAASGLTLTAELFAIGSDTIVDTASATEQTNRAGTYRVAYTDVAAGEYQLVAFSGTTPVASWLVSLTLDTATFQVFERSTAVNMRGTDGANTVVPPAVDAIQSGLATEAKQDTAKTAIDAILLDTDETIPGLIAAIEVPTLTGPWTRTITVTDSVSSDPIQNATVRFFRTGETETQSTDASGVASFTVEAATWSYAIVASGYAGASGTVVVDASGDTAVTLVASVVSVADAPLCAVTLPIKDGYGQPIEGAAVFIKFLGFDDAAPPLGLVLSPPPPLTSDASGLVSVDLIRLANYSVTYSTTEDVRRIDISVPDAGAYTVAE